MQRKARNTPTQRWSASGTVGGTSTRNRRKPRETAALSLTAADVQAVPTDATVAVGKRGRGIVAEWQVQVPIKRRQTFDEMLAKIEAAELAARPVPPVKPTAAHIGEAWRAKKA